jgi:hypothetical protein
LSRIDRAKKLVIDDKVSSERFLSAGPVSETASILFLRRLEGRHRVNPSASCGDVIREANQTDTNRPKPAMVDRTRIRQRPTRVDVALAVAEL